jgi:murein DD-endopeptidase MepM/ murein hydrolase activator NlpD
VPGAASAASGGTGIAVRAVISRVSCKSQCPARASSSSSGAAAKVGSIVRFRGRNFADALRVRFSGGTEVRLKAKGARWLDVRVPSTARTGRPVIIGRYGMRSRPSRTILKIAVPPGQNQTASGSYGMPLPRGYVMTSKFWEARSYERHPGVDLAISSGTAVKAIGAGTVTTAGWTGGYGNYICIRHTSSMSSCYAHESAIGVSVGDRVSRGQVIGRVGCTGSCTGPHLHFEIRVNRSVVCSAPWVGQSSSRWCASGAPGYGTRAVSASAQARSASVFPRSVSAIARTTSAPEARDLLD